MQLFEGHRNHKKMFSLVLAMLMVFSIVEIPSFANPTNIRGVEQSESKLGDTTRQVATGALYIPSQVINGALYGMESVAVFLTDPDFIDMVEDILYIYKKELAWFPVASFASGFRPNYGGGLYYHRRNIKGLFKGTAHDADHWSMSVKGSYTKYLDQMAWKTSLSAKIEKKDDRRFYGIGADPENDERNRFIALGDQDYGIYTEERKKIQWKSSLEPANHWGVTYLGYYQRRDFEDSGRGDNPLRDVFDLSRIPGFSDGSPVEQIYNELSIHVDTRNRKKILSPGWRFETHVGISSGIDENESDFLRAGFDAAAFIPTIKEDRLLVPRISMNFIEDLDNTPIPFTEYPRHHHFRGVSRRELIHSDEVSLNASLEYRWPLSHMFSGHVFVDYVTVGQSVGDLHWNDGIWAAGGGIDLHLFQREFGKVLVAGGSEGFQATLSFGVPLEKNEREDW